MKKYVLALFAFFLFCPHVYGVTFELSGTVTQSPKLISLPNLADDIGLNLGDPFSATIEFGTIYQETELKYSFAPISYYFEFNNGTADSSFGFTNFVFLDANESDMFSIFNSESTIMAPILVDPMWIYLYTSDPDYDPVNPATWLTSDYETAAIEIFIKETVDGQVNNEARLDLFADSVIETVTPVPEPSTILLLSFGIAAFRMRKRRT
jgi:hypothetical protein